MTANFTNPAELAELNNATFYSIYSGIIKSRGSSALWFYPAAASGSYLICMYNINIIFDREQRSCH